MKNKKIILTSFIVIVITLITIVFTISVNDNASTSQNNQPIVQKSEILAESGIDRLSIKVNLDNNFLDSNLILVFFFISTFVSMISIIYLIRVYLWRKNSKEGLIIVPETFSKEIEKIKESVSYHTKSITNENINLHTHVQTLADNFQKYNETLNILKKSLITHERNLLKHEERWDIYVLKKFFDELITAYEISLEEYEELNKNNSNEDVTKSLEVINYELNNILEEAGIEKFFPKIGSNYANQPGISERIGKDITDDINKVGTISRINKPGYIIKKDDSENKNIIIKEALVTVYFSSSSGSNE